jgi:hypothetical protein
MREVGVLVVAFAPLDAIIANEMGIASQLWRSFQFAVGFFLLSVIAEWSEGFLGSWGLDDR